MTSNLPLEDGFTIYQSPYCPHCQRATKTLERLKQGYNIPVKNVVLEGVQGNLQSVLKFFNQHKHYYNFDSSHKTRPVIFYNGDFIGGNQELETLLRTSS